MAEDTIQNTPVSSPLMLKLAEYLRQMGSTSSNDKALPPVLRAIKSQDPFGLKPAADELENQAYGNQPMQQRQDGDQIPFFKPGRQESAAALAALAPVGAANKAMMIPFSINSEIKTPERILKNFQPMMKAINADPQLIKQPYQSDLWHDYQMTEVPRGAYAKQRPDESGRFMYEIPDQDATLNPDVLMSRSNKLRQFLGDNKDWQVAVGSGKTAKTYGKKGEGVENRAKLMEAVNRDMLKPGDYKLSDVLRHPELYDTVPGLGNTPLRVDPKLSAGSGSMSTDKDYNNMITSAINPGKGASPKDILLHEAQHVIQNDYGMPRGANVVGSTLSDKDKMAAAVLALKSPQGGSIRKDAGFLAGAQPLEAYKNVLGEQQARATSDRARLRKSSLATTSPLLSYDDVGQGMSYGTLDAIRQKARSINQSGEAPSPEDIDKLVRMLRQTQ